MSDILLIIPPQHCFLNKSNALSLYKLQYVNAGADIVRASLKESHNVDYIDFDAIGIKNKSVALLDLFNQITSMKEYDYIMFSISYNVMGILEFSYIFVLAIILEIQKKHPNTKFLIGGSSTVIIQSWQLQNQDIRLPPNLFMTDSNIEFFNDLTQKYNIRLPLFLHHEKTFRENMTFYTNHLGLMSTGYLPDDLGSKLNKDNKNHYAVVSQPIKKTLNNVSDIQYTYQEILEILDIPVSMDKKFSGKNIQLAQLVLSDGCTEQCAYCASSIKKYRPLPFNDIVTVLSSYLNQGFNCFGFYDSSSNYYAEKLCNWIIQNNVKIHWSCSWKLNDDDSSFYQMLHEAGCDLVDVGIDITNDDKLKKYSKRNTVDNFKNQLTKLHKADMLISTNFLINMPYETNAEFIETLKFIEDTKDLTHTFAVNTLRLKRNARMGQDPAAFGVKFTKFNYGELTGDYRNRPMALKQLHDSKMDLLFDFCESKNILNKLVTDSVAKKIVPPPPHHLIFMLYDVYKQKQLVVDWLNENYFPKRLTYG